MITEVDRYAEICVQAHNLAEEEAKNMLETELQLDSLDNSKKSIFVDFCVWIDEPLCRC